jgi:predicted  nucleic acid-binding Zn-ribbon protein
MMAMQTDTNMNIKEKLQADLDKAKAKVADLEQKIASIPAEVEQIAEEAWEKVANFFKGL